MPDSLAAADVRPLLRGRFGREYVYVPACPSTQRLLPPDAPEGAVAATDHQTEGRGRLGRSWHDAPGTALLVSVALAPALPAERLPELTVVAARACADAIASVAGLRPTLKPPNDLLLGGRKVAGVLGEAAGGRVALGVGVNVNQTAAELPSGTPLPATSLRLETGGEVDRGELLAELLLTLERAYDAWVSAASGPAG
jgi:BirA family transcriptional regulator, biotin operon repressor / biotin---[acetyl-CoA-carboxylase] ligase